MGWYFKKPLSYLKSTSRIFLNKKFRARIDMPKFGTKNALFGYLGLKLEKVIVMFVINPEIL